MLFPVSQKNNIFLIIEFLKMNQEVTQVLQNFSLILRVIPV